MPYLLAALAIGICLSISTVQAAEDLAPNELAIEVDFPWASGAIGFGFGSAWVADGKRLLRISQADNQWISIDLKTRHDHSYRGIAFGEGAVWLTDISENNILKVDPGTNQVVDVIPAPLLSALGSIGVGAGSVWVVTSQKGEKTLTRFSVRTGKVETRIDLPSAGSGVSYDGKSVWVTAPAAGELFRIDPETNQISATTKLSGLPRAMAVKADSIWITDERDPSVHRIDAITGKVLSTIETGLRFDCVLSIFATEDFVWVDSTGVGAVQIDPRKNEVTRRIDWQGQNWELAYGDGSLWMGGTSVRRVRLPS